MTAQHQRRPHRHNGYPAEQRGRRIRWRAATLTIFALLLVSALWLVDRLGWPQPIAVPAVTIPYWSVVLAVWRRHGPHMPGLHETIAAHPRHADPTVTSTPSQP